MKAYGVGCGWRVEKILRAEGFYWPYLLCGGVPQALPTLWVDGLASCLRANTVEAYLRDLKILYEVAEKEGFPIEERMAELRGFSPRELQIVASSMAKTSGGRPASKSTCVRRTETLKGFIRFAFEHYKASKELSLLEQAQADRNAERQCKFLAKRLRVEGNVGSGPRRSVSLTPVEMSLVEGVISPSSPLNPFKSPPIRFRNYCLIRLMYATAMRRAEVVLLEMDDVFLNGSPTIRVKKPTNLAQRKRRDGASMKTVGREIPISYELAGLLEIYRDRWRQENFNATAPSSAFFISSRDGRRLSAYSINKVFETVQEVAATLGLEKRFHPHGMRSTAVDEIRRKVAAEGHGGTSALHDALAYVGGWSHRSPMIAHYTRASISERLASAIRSERKEKEDSDE